MKEFKEALQKFTQAGASQPYYALAMHLSQRLESNLGIGDLATLIAIIEQIPLNKGMQLGDYITRKKRDVLANYQAGASKPGFPPKLFSRFTTDAKTLVDQLLPSFLSSRRDKEFLEKMGDLHRYLTKLMKNKLAQTNSLSGGQIKYTPDQLETSEEYRSLETQSKLPTLPDNVNLAKDAIRGNSIKFNGKIYKGTFTFNNQKYPATEDNFPLFIEKFTGENPSVIGGRANKIFSFGGQALQGTLLSECSFTTEFEGKAIDLPFVSSSTNWYTTKEGEIEAEIALNIYGISTESGEFYFLNTECTNLERDDNLVVVSGILRDIKGEMTLRNPVASIKGKIQLAGTHPNHYLKVESTTISYHTDQLKSLFDRPAPPRTSEALRDWGPIKSILDAHPLNKKHISRCLRILQSLNSKELEAFREFARSDGSFKEKIVDIVVNGQVLNQLSNQGFQLLSNKLGSLFGVKRFQDMVRLRHQNYNINVSIEQFTQFFTKLKTNSPDLSLQELVAAFNGVKGNLTEQEVIVDKLFYVLSRVNAQPNFCLSVQDLEKFKKLEAETALAYGSNQELLQIMKCLLIRLEMLNKRHQLNDKVLTFAGNRREQVLTPQRQEEYARQVILCTKAKMKMSNIQKARKVIAHMKPNLTEDNEIYTAGLLDTQLSRVHANLSTAIQTGVTSDNIEKQMRLSEHYIKAAACEKQPSFPFLQMLKNVFLSIFGCGKLPLASGLKDMLVKVNDEAMRETNIAHLGMNK